MAIIISYERYYAFILQGKVSFAINNVYSSSHLSSPRNISLFDQNIVKSEMTELEMRKNDSLLLLLSFSYLCNMIWQKERKSKQNDGDNIDYPSIML